MSSGVKVAENLPTLERQENLNGAPATASVAFRYFDKGAMAVVGKNFAILESGCLHMSGFISWLVWALGAQYGDPL